jgi:glycosyltransferase involved in cell wall biosynthesis
VDNLLKAYKQFVELTHSDVRMVIVGERMWKKEQRNQPSHTHESAAVIFTGRLETSELRRVMGSALALTFVPWYEGFGIPVIEAMAAGVPVLTSNVTSLPEVGGKAVLYADPASVESIAEGIKQLAENEDLRNDLIQKGLERQRLFSWDRTARKVWLSIDTVIRAIRDYEHPD